MGQTKIIFIDWYITLSTSHYWGHLRDTDREGYDLFEGWLLGNLDIFDEWMRGRYTSGQISQMIAESTRRSADYVLAELRESCKLITMDLPELHSELRRIRQQGTPVVVATDNILDFSQCTVPAQGLLDIFDDVLNSAELGVLKSDEHSNFFDSYLLAKGIAPENAVLIDDSDKVEEALADHPIRHLKVANAYDTLDLLRTM